MRCHRDDGGAIQILESILVGLFVFIAIALVSVQRLPTNPATFQESKLLIQGSTILTSQAGKIPEDDDDCNESPCPFGSELDRYLSLTLGYQGPTIAAGEEPDSSDLLRFLDDTVPSGSRYQIVLSNGHNATILAPLNLNPPSTSVVVARALVSPNWTVHDANREASVWVRSNDLTGFGTLTALRDPLNRTSTEFGATWVSLFGTRVPANATYGTHQVCTATQCSYVTVVPDDVAGPGTQIRTGDQQPSGTLTSMGTWILLAKYYDAASDGFGATDPIYLDVDGTGTTSAGDIRISAVTACRGTATCQPGSTVRSTDNDLLRAVVILPLASLKLRSTDSVTDEGEGVYLDADGNALTGPGDMRLARVGLLGMGTRLVAGESDAGQALDKTYTGAELLYADADEDSSRDEGETVFLDLEGLGQTVSLDAFDLRLTPQGFASARNVYDLRLVMWYGA